MPYLDCNCSKRTVLACVIVSEVFHRVLSKSNVMILISAVFATVVVVDFIGCDVDDDDDDVVVVGGDDDDDND